MALLKICTPLEVLSKVLCCCCCYFCGVWDTVCGALTLWSGGYRLRSSKLVAWWLQIVAWWLQIVAWWLQIVAWWLQIAEL